MKLERLTGFPVDVELRLVSKKVVSFKYYTPKLPNWSYPRVVKFSSPQERKGIEDKVESHLRIMGYYGGAKVR